MKNLIKNAFYASAGLLLVGLNSANAITFNSSQDVDANLV